MTPEEIEQKYAQFRNTMWCAPKHFEAVNKHKQAFIEFFKDLVIDPVVKDDSYMPENMVLLVTKDLQLKIIKIK